MASPPVLDIESLVAPIPGDDPAGGPVPLPLRETLDLARKEIDPADFDAADPARPTEMKRADWPGIIERTEQTLTESSKDLMIVARLTEALVKTHGFAGLRDGFALFHRLIAECWDRLRPVIEEPDDLEARAAAFNWLDDTDRGARFPITLRQATILTGPKGPISWMEWSYARSGKGKITGDDFEQSVTAMTRADCLTVFEDIDAAVQELQKLMELLNGRMGNLAPGMTMLRQAVFDCRTLAQQILDRKPAAEELAAEEGAAEGAEGGGGGGGGGPSVSRSMNSRADVYRRLAEAADVLEKLEPHSPIPYIIRRAVTLGELPFPKLAKALISDAAVLYDLGRNLGISNLHEQ
jgi:type VI secretion system protein ImpA